LLSPAKVRGNGRLGFGSLNDVGMDLGWTAGFLRKKLGKNWQGAAFDHPLRWF